MVLGAIDLGGTKIYTVLSDGQGKILARERVATRASEGPEVVARQMRDSLQGLMRQQGIQPGRLEGVGVCAAGYFDWEKRCLIYSPNLVGWEQIPLENFLSQRLEAPVRVENDANAAALGEWKMGAGQGVSDLLYLTVSTGIGAGLILDGRLYRGQRGLAGEAGHIPVNPKGVRCGCGQRGCLETEASGTALARKGAAAAAAGTSTVLQALSKDKTDRGAIEAADVFAAAQEGDRAAQAIVLESVEYLAMGLTGIIHLLNPERIVLGGGVTKAGHAFFDPLRAALEVRTIPALFENLTIEAAVLGDESGIWGMLSSYSTHASAKMS